MNPDKFKFTGIDLQSINGNSIITFFEYSQTQKMIKFFSLVRIANCENKKLKKDIQLILSEFELKN
ncbi:MAG: hypothetical protein FWH29_06095 [Methanobrevibacter sp.]|nr:hypothetical protein [Methanobrevibacter sp.]